MQNIQNIINIYEKFLDKIQKRLEDSISYSAELINNCEGDFIPTYEGYLGIAQRIEEYFLYERKKMKERMKEERDWQDKKWGGTKPFSVNMACYSR